MLFLVRHYLSQTNFHHLLFHETPINSEMDIETGGLWRYFWNKGREQRRSRPAIFFLDYAAGRLIRNRNTESSLEDSTSWLPVCRQNASKSETDPGSVDRISSVSPAATSFSAFLALRMGKGQLSPFASSVWSAIEVKLRLIYLQQCRSNEKIDIRL